MTAGRAYRIERESTTEKFHQSDAKFQAFTGGFGSGKTTAVVIKALKLARDYPGSNGLVARATYPKLNDTVRKEWFYWMPASWRRSFNKTDNTLELTNGSVVNFRYVSQRTNEAGEGTSNLLSNTYDWILFDQLEDPEIGYKDFLDLVGRLRGSTRYAGDDPSMPLTGPRWFMFTANPTRNWLYRRIVKPKHDHDQGLWNPELLCERDAITEQPLLDNYGRPLPIIALFEGSTYENQDNLPADFIKTLEATYRGQMRERFLLGKWVGYEGQVYADFDQTLHVVPNAQMQSLFRQVRMRSAKVTMVEAFDHGIAEPNCYLMGFVDNQDNVHVMDGFYEAGLGIEAIAKRIHAIRERYGVLENDVLADPAVFRRGSAQVVGPTVASMLADHGVTCVRANNALINGITKVQTYLGVMQHRLHPYLGRYGSPRLFVSDSLHWWVEEITDYVWMKDRSDEVEDKPRDKKNHAMDTTRYLLTDRPDSSTLMAIRNVQLPAYLLGWSEQPDEVTA